MVGFIMYVGSAAADDDAGSFTVELGASDDEGEKASPQSKTLIIAASITFGVALLLVVAITICFARRRTSREQLGQSIETGGASGQFGNKPVRSSAGAVSNTSTAKIAPPGWGHPATAPAGTRVVSQLQAQQASNEDASSMVGRGAKGEADTNL
jgi:hypothetical protein